MIRLTESVNWIGTYRSGETHINTLNNASLPVFIWIGAIILVLPFNTGRAEDCGIPEPGIVFDSVTHDFGSQVAGTLLKHIFRFENQGSAPLLIHDLKAG